MFSIRSSASLILFSSLVVFGATDFVFAQVSPTEPRPWEGSQSEDPNRVENVFNGSGGGAGSLMELINRIQQSDGPTLEEYVQNQDKNFNSAVSDFHKKQQEAIQQQGETQSEIAPEQPL